MGLGAAKMARESAKSPDEFEGARRRACLFEARSGINYAQSRASFRCGEIRILDSSGEVKRIIAFNETDRKL